VGKQKKAEKKHTKINKTKGERKMEIGERTKT
jgi:hypothetical protein